MAITTPERRTVSVKSTTVASITVLGDVQLVERAVCAENVPPALADQRWVMPVAVWERTPKSAVVPAWSIGEGLAARVTVKGRTVIVTVSVSVCSPSETITWKMSVAPAARAGAVNVG